MALATPVTAPTDKGKEPVKMTPTSSQGKNSDDDANMKDVGTGEKVPEEPDSDDEVMMEVRC
jgi:hypothetical protein